MVRFINETATSITLRVTVWNRCKGIVRVYDCREPSRMRVVELTRWNKRTLKNERAARNALISEVRTKLGDDW